MNVVISIQGYINGFLFHCQIEIIFVIGNESCDLDSAASAIGLAYFYNKLRPEELKKFLPHFNEFVKRKHIFIPLLNITTDERPLKTDVIFSLKNNSIEYSMVPDM